MQNPYQHPPNTPSGPSTSTAYAPNTATANTGAQGYGYDPRGAELARLAQETRTWTIVAAVGWFVGFMWVLGPLAWYQATKIAGEYASLGASPPGELNTLRLIGMVTTILSVVFVVFTTIAVVTYIAFFLTAFRR